MTVERHQTSPGTRRRRPLRAVTAVLASSAAVAALTMSLAGSAAAQTSLAGGGGPAPADTAAPACTSGTTVRTHKGAVCGVTKDNVTSYLGIPYAAPPVRWKSPRPHKAWRTTLHATEPGNECPQPGFGGPPVTTENCLNLNVRAPSDARPGKNLPVMVLLHGGGFEFFGPSDGTPLVTAGNVVYVGVNYRLGVFGFLAEKGFGPHAGDYGLQDQQAALRWVKHNISRFGGDPRNVTIFGASAGGSSVCDQTTSPTARGLFQKGISENGSYNAAIGKNTSWQPQDCTTVLPNEAQAQAAGARYAKALGCTSRRPRSVAACLRGLPAAKLLAQVGDGLAPDSGTIAPIVNGTTLPTSPVEAFRTGRVNHVTLTIGVARDENHGGAPSPVANAAAYRHMVRQQYGRLARAVLRLYPVTRFPSPFIALRTVVADSDAVCPTIRNDQRLSRHIPVFAYEVDDADAPPTGFLNPSEPNGAYHISGTTLLFSTAASGFDANQQALAKQLKSEWTGFARTGDPTVPDTPRWTRFTDRQPMVMSLVPAGDSALLPAGVMAQQHHCGFWDAVSQNTGR